MSKTVWRKGPPPSIGWWPVSTGGNIHNGTIRWWDGAYWSYAVYETDSAEDAGHWAKKPSTYQDSIVWSIRPKSWPARSRT